MSASPELGAAPSVPFSEAGGPPAAVADLTVRIAGMSCAACQVHVQRALAATPGVEDAIVDLLANTAHLRVQPGIDPSSLTAAVRRAGYDLLPETAPERTNLTQASTTNAEAELDAGHRHLGTRALLALLAGSVAMGLSMPLMAGNPSHADVLSRTLMQLAVPFTPASLLAVPPSLLRWTLLLLALGTMLFAAPEIYTAAWRAARHSATNMNTLVALGTLVAFGASAYATVTLSIGRPSQNFNDVYFEAVVLILAFLLAGRWLEARARHRATANLRSFAQQEAGSARWLAEGSPETLAADLASLLNAPETLLPLDAIAVGDLIRVLPGDRIPLDGIVLAGRSSVDESMLTGEPLPVLRAAGDKLFSGTLNFDGPLLLRATALGADSMQAQMARLLARARATRAPSQRLADRASAVFVPTVLVVAAFTFSAWAAADNSGPRHLGYGRALSLAVAVLVVACPCAMGLAVPAAVAVALGTAARAGILIKGGEALERLATVCTVAFDKTGTLTEGHPSVVSFTIAANPQSSQQQLLQWAAAVEQLATHPLAQAVCAFARDSESTAASAVDARNLPGIGTQATVDGRLVALGSAALLLEAGQPVPPVPPVPKNLAQATPVYLLVDGRHEATLYATDTLRPSARPTLEALHALHLSSLLLTGDTLGAAQALATQTGIVEVRARLLPGDKVAAIAALQAQGRSVAMVGDGLNDAAALAQADAGIAMASGTDLAREAGHVLLLHHDLLLVPRAIRLARRTRRLMRQNLGWAILYNLLGIPVAGGLLLPHFGIALSPALASAAMALSSVSVLVNSLRLARNIGPQPAAPGTADLDAARRTSI